MGRHTPVPLSTAPPSGRSRSAVSARARRRSRRRAALRRRIPRSAAPREDARVAPRTGRDRRTRHLLRPALRATTSRCATCSKRSSRTRADVDASTLDEIQQLHEAVLAEHRTLQQPHRAQVRPDLSRRSALADAARAAARAGATFPLSTGETLDRLLAASAADVLRSRRRPDRHEQDAAARPGHPDRERRTTSTTA